MRLNRLKITVSSCSHFGTPQLAVGAQIEHVDRKTNPKTSWQRPRPAGWVIMRYRGVRCPHLTQYVSSSELQFESLGGPPFMVGQLRLYPEPAEGPSSVPHSLLWDPRRQRTIPIRLPMTCGVRCPHPTHKRYSRWQ